MHFSQSDANPYSGSTLWVIGDSFSTPPDVEGHPRRLEVWTEALGQQLGVKRVVNNSVIGSAQDWINYVLTDWQRFIKPDDYVLLVLTHPGRFWYFQDLPSLTNANIIDLDDHVSRERAEAIRNYILQIQRPELDTLWVINRMSWVGYATHRFGWRKPLIVKAFAQAMDEAETYPDIGIAKGNLFNDIQYREFNESKLGEQAVKDHVADFWQGIDCRYNHMCLRNHHVLADKCADFFQGRADSVDLTQGFHYDFLDRSVFDHSEFCEQEFDPVSLKRNREEFANNKYVLNKNILPWHRRVGINTRNQ